MTDFLEIVMSLMLLSDAQTGLLYSDAIQRNMNKLKKRGIDLKQFFTSQLAYHRVSYDYFREYEAIEE